MFWKEKYTKNFLIEIVCIACLMMVTGIVLISLQENRLKHLLFAHDAAVASSLLEQGVSRQTVAEALLHSGIPTEEEELIHTGSLTEEEALLHTVSQTEGETLLRQIGLSEKADISTLPILYRFCAAQRTMVSLCGVLFFALLFFSVFRYLQKREHLYREAIGVIENYMENDFSQNLPELCEGTLFQLFSRINFMAAMLKTRQEAENKAKEFLKRMVSDISHQLKTPLAALSMYQEIILNEPEQAETVTVFTEKSALALARMEGLIQNLLKITRLDAGNVVFCKKHFPAAEVVSQAVEALTDRAACEEKELIITGDEKTDVYCDIEWSREALGNIVKNALDHTAAGDRITVTWDNSPLMTRFTVADTGEGIAEEDIYHIFERFYRSENSHDRQGTGLGLALAKSVMEGQGGTVSVQSEAGRGTVFTVSFPRE